MRVFVEGRPNKLGEKEIVFATEFFASLLMSKRLQKDVIVHIECLDDGSDGFMHFLDDNRRPREFQININNRISKRKQLITLAHEMVHVKQYVKGELKYLSRKDEDRWLGSIVRRDLHYYDRPWEIEAFGRELGLVQRYILHKNENKIKF